MSQDATFTRADSFYATGHEADDDLANIQKALFDLFSSFGGAAAPSNVEGGVQWLDTNKLLMKYRTGTTGGHPNSWYGILAGKIGSAGLHTWVYNASPPDGWIHNTSYYDTVLAIAGGSGSYNTGGGAYSATSWSVSGLAHENPMPHTHTMGNHAHTLGNGTPDTTIVAWRRIYIVGNELYAGFSDTGGQTRSRASIISGAPSDNVSDDVSTPNTGNAGGGDGSWRPPAQVGILIYPDL